MSIIYQHNESDAVANTTLIVKLNILIIDLSFAIFSKGLFIEQTLIYHFL